MSAAFIEKQLATFASDLEGELDVAPDIDFTALAHLLKSIRACRSELALVEQRITRDLVEFSEGKRAVFVEGLGHVEITKKKKRTEWDSAGLWRVLCARALDERHQDLATGEFEPREQAVARVLEECARPSWRVTALRQHGIDETEFCHIEDDGLTVRLPS